MQIKMIVKRWGSADSIKAEITIEGDREIIEAIKAKIQEIGGIEIE